MIVKGSLTSLNGGTTKVEIFSKEKMCFPFSFSKKQLPLRTWVEICFLWFHLFWEQNTNYSLFFYVTSFDYNLFDTFLFYRFYITY